MLLKELSAFKALYFIQGAFIFAWSAFIFPAKRLSIPA
jgi:hypothetical protein